MGKTRSVAMGVATFLVLGFLAPLIIADQAMAGGGFNFVLSLCIVWISAGRLSVLVARGETRMLTLGFHLFVYPFLGLAALAQVTSGRYPLDNRSYTTAEVSAGLIVALTGIVAFEVGSVLGAIRSSGKVLAEPQASGISPGGRVFSQGRIIVSALIGLMFVAWSLVNLGLATFFSSRDQASAALAGSQTVQVYELADKSAYLIRNAGVHVPILVALVAVLVLLRSGSWRAGPLGRPAAYAFLFVLVVGNVVANNPLSNSRFWSGIVIMGVGGALLKWREPAGFRSLAFAGLAVLVLAFGLLDAFRRAVYDFSFVAPRDQYLADGSYSAFQTIMNGNLYLESEDYAGGRQLLTAVMVFIPRRMWTEKSVDTGALIDTRYNRASSLWSEFQVDFGIAGVILGFLLLGVAVARLELIALSATSDWIHLMPMLAGLMIFLLRGSLVSAMGSAYPLLLVFFFVLRKRSRGIDQDQGSCAEPIHGVSAAHSTGAARYG